MSERLVKFFKQNRFIKFGLPFFVLIIGGSFGMREFSQVRYQHRGVKMLSPEEMKQEMENAGIRTKKRVSIEKEFEKIQKMDIDTWENKRGPRPWEENNPTNLELEERAKAIKLSQKASIK